MDKFKYIIFIFLVVLSTSCSNNKPVPINTRQDNCAYCKMGITNKQFASELITSKGKVYKFDSIECMAMYYKNHKKTYNKSPELWMHDYLNPQKWIPLRKAIFMRCQKIHSPMALDLIAVKKQSEVNRIKQKFGGSRIKWKRLLVYVSKNMNKN